MHIKFLLIKHGPVISQCLGTKDNENKHFMNNFFELLPLDKDWGYDLVVSCELSLCFLG